MNNNKILKSLGLHCNSSEKAVKEALEAKENKKALSREQMLQLVKAATIESVHYGNFSVVEKFPATEKYIALIIGMSTLEVDDKGRYFWRVPEKLTESGQVVEEWEKVSAKRAVLHYKWKNSEALHEAREHMRQFLSHDDGGFKNIFDFPIRQDKPKKELKLEQLDLLLSKVVQTWEISQVRGFIRNLSNQIHE